jgi:hypothetical protein
MRAGGDLPLWRPKFRDEADVHLIEPVVAGAVDAIGTRSVWDHQRQKRPPRKLHFRRIWYFQYFAVLRGKGFDASRRENQC